MRKVKKCFIVLLVLLSTVSLFSKSGIKNTFSLSDMIFVKGGSFIQQDANAVSGKVNKSFIHNVSSFYIGKYEVSYEIWKSVYDWAVIKGYTFDNEGLPGMVEEIKIEDTGKLPVTNISYYDALVWCNAYSEKFQYEPVYYSADGEVVRDIRNLKREEKKNIYANWEANGYRLPTEGEWYFAARSRGAEGNIKVKQKMTDRIYDVDDISCNKLGLYGVDHNVWEWIWDWYGTLPSGKKRDYRGPGSGDGKITLGGQAYICDHIISGHRLGVITSIKNSFIGLRVARSGQ
ncbi:MAG: SUMF1/EgtB/PvdO family nonheme iron enzyme [Spirochaetes bacterium]|nr:SUMF1/EgtB/PvdO family nonheme iron enzyme [Spirochaetota bacterium]MBN2770738.1 SUMF1/EgtB/PvdO family nonheme iron enzyme [Spirochaetota bacterium]